MTVAAEAVYVEMLRYVYALSTSQWPLLVAHTAVAGLVGGFVIVVWSLRGARRDARRAVRSLTRAHRGRTSGV